MIPFDENNPFPLLSEEDYTYEEAQAHAQAVDAWLGLRCSEIEERLSSWRAESEESDLPQQHWVGLPIESLMTPYLEIRTLLALLAPEAGERVVDLGCAYGRMGFVLGRHYSGVEFIGYEVVQERVEEARRCLAQFQYPRVRVEQADLSLHSFQMPEADFYFLYDYGSRQAIEKTLQDLKAIAANRAIQVIGRGRSSRDAIERRHPWLSQVIKPRHFPHYSIYRCG